MPRIKTCFVKGCPGKLGWRKSTPLPFFSVPAIITTGNKKYSGYGMEERQKKMIELSIRRRAAWLKALKRDNSTENNWIRICGRHFISGRSADLEDDENPDWIPSINLGYKTSKVGKTKAAVKKHEKKKLNEKRNAAVKLYGGSSDPPVFFEVEGYEEVLVPETVDFSSDEDSIAESEPVTKTKDNVTINGEIPIETSKDDAHSTKNTTTDKDEKYGHWHVHFCRKKACLFSKTAAKSNAAKIPDEDV